jgi:hypothetical protein
LLVVTQYCLKKQNKITISSIFIDKIHISYTNYL